MTSASYIGRFAPSPTGLLHRGSLAAALASRLDAQAHGGRWLVRIEDIDPPRDVPGADRAILETLRRLGMSWDGDVVWQSRRHEAYEAAFEALRAKGLVYGCACSRREAQEAALRSGLPKEVYPGTCRKGTNGRPVRAWRFAAPDADIGFVDRWMGEFHQNPARSVGDFVVKRADGLWAYQLAVVVDDIAGGVTDIVRGADLLDNTPRQMALWRALGAEPPRYMHVPLVLNGEGEKLSKQQGATPLNPDALLEELEAAFVHLGFPRINADSTVAFHREAERLWRERWIG